MQVLITVQPYHGHLASILPAARVLMAAGHYVLVATQTAFVPFASGAGMKSIATSDDALKLGNWNEGAIRVKVHDVLASLDQSGFRPDLIIREIADFSGIVIAELLGVPFVTMGMGLHIDPTWWRRLLKGGLDRVRADYGLESDAELAHLRSAPYFDLTPSWFQLPSDASPPNYYRFKVLPEPAALCSLPRWLPNLEDKPTIYISLGTVYSDVPLLRRLVRFAASRSRNVICTVGPGRDPEDILSLDLPSVFVEQYIPYSAILDICDVTLIHGGYNTTLGSLTAGIPPLLTPLGSDQFANARRCVELGIGLRFRKEQITRRLVNENLEMLLAPNPFRERLSGLLRNDVDVPVIDQAVRILERIGRPTAVQVSMRRKGCRECVQPDLPVRADTVVASSSGSGTEGDSNGPESISIHEP